MKKKGSFPTSWYIRLLVFLVFSVIIRKYKIRSRMPEEVRKLKPPYLVLSNHVGQWDPFLVGHFLKPFTHFVSSDAVFRNMATGFFLRRLGVIPKKKNIRDTKVIRNIIGVIREGHPVGIFPEGVRNYSGCSLPMDPSIAKLISLLNVPVVTVVMKGMNLFNPRWSKKLRHTQVDVEYELLLDKNDLIKLNAGEIHEKVANALQHDEVAWQQQQMNPIRSGKKAEYISQAIYLCPSCEAIDSFDCHGNDFQCRDCTYSIQIDEYGFFRREDVGKLHFDNIRDWDRWQQDSLIQLVGRKWEEGDPKAIFRDKASLVYESRPDESFELLGHADISMHTEYIKIEFVDEREPIKFYFDKLDTINPQMHERLEIYYENQAWRITGGREGVSSLKWEIAVNAVWKKTGEDNKVAGYL